MDGMFGSTLNKEHDGRHLILRKQLAIGSYIKRKLKVLIDHPREIQVGSLVNFGNGKNSFLNFTRV